MVRLELAHKNMKKIDFNVIVTINDTKYNVGVELAGALRRIDVKDESGIRKVQVYIDHLKKGVEFKLDEVDFEQLKVLIIASDVWQGIKMEALTVYDKIGIKSVPTTDPPGTPPKP